MSQQLRFPFPRPPRTEQQVKQDIERVRKGAEERKERFWRPLIDVVRSPMPTTETAPGARDQTDLTRDQRRSRRHHAVRALTIPMNRVTQRELALRREEDREGGELPDVPRPRTRGDCSAVPRPCPFVACKHHVYLDVSARSGSIKINFPDLEPDELPADESCVLDVADRDGTTLEHVGKVMNLTRERVRQVEVKGLARLEALKDLETLRDVVDGRSKRHTAKHRLAIVEEKPVDPDAGAGGSVAWDEFASSDIDE